MVRGVARSPTSVGGRPPRRAALRVRAGPAAGGAEGATAARGGSRVGAREVSTVTSGASRADRGGSTAMTVVELGSCGCAGSWRGSPALASAGAATGNGRASRAAVSTTISTGKPSSVSGGGSKRTRSSIAIKTTWPIAAATLPVVQARCRSVVMALSRSSAARMSILGELALETASGRTMAGNDDAPADWRSTSIEAKIGVGFASIEINRCVTAAVRPAHGARGVRLAGRASRLRHAAEWRLKTLL